MLPRLEMSRDECRKCLRCLELDAYANMVSVLRAQGPFSVDKKTLLQELASVLHISNERHRAEIRRAVNDDKLSAIAEQLNGPNTGTDWAIEGRRMIPLLPRLKAHNAFTTLANSLSIVTAIANEKEPRNIKKPVDVKEMPSKTKSTPVVNVDVPESRKRKRSAMEVHDNECGPQKNFTLQKSVAPNLMSPSLPAPPPNKLLILPSVSSHEAAKQKNVKVIPVAANAAPAHNLIPQTLVCNNTTVQIPRSNANSTVPINIAKSERKLMTIRAKVAQNAQTNNGIETEVKDININADKAIKLVSISNNIQKVSKSDLNSNMRCVKTLPVTTTDSVTSVTDKCVPQTNASQSLTTNTPCFTSCGPGPPPNETAKVAATFLHNKFPPLKINKIPAAKMVGAKLATKGNFIVLQKTPLREITLSHGGKEVVGKLIMGGKNLRLANQQNANITLVPHRTSTQITNCNGEQSTTNSAITTVHTKTNSITSNTLESNKTAMQFDHGPTNFDVKFEAELVDQTEEDFLSHDKSNDSTTTISSIENNSQDDVSLSEEPRDGDDTTFHNSELNYESNMCDDEESEDENSATIVEGFLDPQTGIYNIQSTTENANSIEVEDFSTTELFESDLNPAKLNVESYTLMETEETSAILDATGSTMLIIDEIDEICDS